MVVTKLRSLPALTPGQRFPYSGMNGTFVEAFFSQAELAPTEMTLIDTRHVGATYRLR
jgi:hypothetical protein